MTLGKEQPETENDQSVRGNDPTWARSAPIRDVCFPSNLAMTPLADFRFPLRAAAVLLLPIILTSCGGGGDGIAPPPAVTAVSVSPGAVPLQGVGASVTVTAALTPSTATGTITWKTNDAAIATVSGSGASATVTAVGGGTTTVTATVGSVSGSASITVTPVVRAIAVAPAAANLTVGGSTQITATLTADAGASQALQWTSSAPTIATVDGTGTITGVAPGNATITVTSTVTPSVTASVEVAVSYPTVTSVTIAPGAPTVLLGATRQLTATVNAGGGVSTAVTWSSSATSVATVSSTGLVTAIAVGTTTISATSVANPTVSGTTVVTVSAPTVRGITLTPTTAGVTQGATRQLTAVVDADAGADAALTWTSSNPTVAQVSGTGLVTAVTPGTATVRATSVLVPAVFASSAITVTEPPPLTNWVAQPSVPPASLLNYYMTGTYSLTGGTAWGVQILNGNDRRMLRYDGAQWITTDDAPFPQVYSIGGFGDQAWIGSTTGRLARLSINAGGAQSWIAMNSPTTAAIRHIIGTSASTAVAGTYFRVLTLTNGVWSLVPTGGAWVIADIAATANDNIVAVLYAAVDGSRVKRWNGTTWMTVTDAPIGGELSAVRFRGTDLVVSNSLNQSAIYDGTNWSLLTVPASRTGTVGEFIGSIMNCNGQVYGSTYVGGRVFRLSGTSWTTIGDYGASVVGSSNSDLNCGADNVLRATGATGGIGRYTGSGWVWEIGSPSIERIVMVRPDLAWAAGGYGMVRKWDGTRWTTEFSDATAGSTDAAVMKGLSVAVDGTVMATRSIDPVQSGAIYRRQSNGTWITDNVSGYCEAVWASSSTHALAVGAGCGLRWNGTAWSSVTGLPTTSHAIDGSSPTNAIAVGQNGSQSASSRWDGTTWTPLTTPHVGALRAVRVASATAAYALGDLGVLRWDGTQWNTVSLPIELSGILPFRDISVNGPAEVYVLTSGAALWRYNGSTWTFQAQVSGAQGDAFQDGPRSLATLPGYGMIGTGAGTVLHASSIGAVRGGIAIEGLRLAPPPTAVDAGEAGRGAARRMGGPPNR